MTKGVKVTLAVVAGLAALSGLCCMGTLVAGLALDDAPAPTAARSAALGGGGFGFSPPSSFQQRGDTWRREQADGDELHFVEVRRLPPVAGLGEPERKLATLWEQVVVPAFKPLPIHDRIPTPLTQRRFVENGARAHFGRARVLRRDTGDAVFVTVYLVEADDHLEPLLVTQGRDGSTLAMNLSFGMTHAWVDEFFRGITGSPTGLPLVSDEEVTGHFKSGGTSTAQWVNTMTGGTTMTGVASATEYRFEDDHTFTYKSAAGAGQMGAMKFGFQEDRGTWRVEHDVLVVDGEQFDQRYFISGATWNPEGRRLLVLHLKPHWSLAPETPFEVYEQAD